MFARLCCFGRLVTFEVISLKAARACLLEHSVLSFTVSMLHAQEYCAVITLVISPRKCRDKVTTEPPHGTTRARHDAINAIFADPKQTHIATHDRYWLEMLKSMDGCTAKSSGLL
jgi:hypothetical protein